MDRNEKQNSSGKTRNVRGRKKRKQESRGRAAGLAAAFVIFAVLFGIFSAVYLYWGR